MEAELMEKLTAEDLPEPYKTIAEFCGIETVVMLAEHFGGSQVTFQKLDTMLYPLKERLIRQEFNGYNYFELMRKYNCSVSWIRKITSDITDKTRNKPITGQMNLFGEENTKDEN